MTGEQLRDELARIAEGAPEVTVDDDLFARGRRATARARVLAGAAAVACLALVVGLSTQVLRSDEAPVADGSTGGRAVPDHVYAPPAHVTDQDADGGWTTDLLTDDLAIGTAAAAYLTDTGLPVVVDAETGGYHLLDLEEITTRSPLVAGFGTRAIALSPDGRQLAWAWARTAGTELGPSGVRVADLETGAVRQVRVDRADAVLVHDLAWSSNGRWLAWAGHETRRWTHDEYRPRSRTVGGVIGPGDTASSPVVLAGRFADVITEGRGETVYPGAPTALAVADDGRLASVVGWALYDDGRRSRIENHVRTGGLWFQGRQLFALQQLSGVLSVHALPDGRSHPASTDVPEPVALGAVGPRQLLIGAGVGADLGDDGSPSVVELVAWDDDSEGTTVIEVDPGVQRLSIADRLVDPDRPTVTRPEPDWPWSTGRTIAVYGGSALLVVLLAGGAWLVVRRLRG